MFRRNTPNESIPEHDLMPRVVSLRSIFPEGYTPNPLEEGVIGLFEDQDLACRIPEHSDQKGFGPFGDTYFQKQRMEVQLETPVPQTRLRRRITVVYEADLTLYEGRISDLVIEEFQEWDGEVIPSTLKKYYTDHDDSHGRFAPIRQLDGSVSGSFYKRGKVWQMEKDRFGKDTGWRKTLSEEQVNELVPRLFPEFI